MLCLFATFVYCVELTATTNKDHVNMHPHRHHHHHHYRRNGSGEMEKAVLVHFEGEGRSVYAEWICSDSSG